MRVKRRFACETEGNLFDFGTGLADLPRLSQAIMRQTERRTLTSTWGNRKRIVLFELYCFYFRIELNRVFIV